MSAYRPAKFVRACPALKRGNARTNMVTVGEKVCSLADEEESAASHPIPRNSWPSCENCRPRDGSPHGDAAPNA